MSIGYDTDRFKLAAFVVSGTIAGLAGALYALANRLAGLDAIDGHTSGAIVMMTILGGIGTIYGPTIARRSSGRSTSSSRKRRSAIRPTSSWASCSEPSS